MTSDVEMQTEHAVCQIHGVPESYTYGEDFKACGGCWHVWPTADAFRFDVREAWVEMNVYDEADVPDDLSAVCACPLCGHDFRER